MKYDPIMCMMVDDTVKAKDANWTEAYKEMENVMNKFSMQGISTSIIYDRVKELYTKHKGDPAWETAWQKFKGSNTLDKAIKSCDTPNIKESLKQDIKSGKITIKQAGREMYEAGMFNWIPDENEVKRKLGL